MEELDTERLTSIMKHAEFLEINGFEWVKIDPVELQEIVELALMYKDLED